MQGVWAQAEVWVQQWAQVQVQAREEATGRAHQPHLCEESLPEGASKTAKGAQLVW